MADSDATGKEPAAQNTKELTSQGKREVTSAEDFLTKSPLYVLTRVNGFSPPSQISLECSGECGKETTWYRVYYPTPVGGRDQDETKVADYAIHAVAYTCFLCKKETMTIIYREMEFEKRDATRFATGLTRSSSPPSTHNVLVSVMKIGQYPEPTVGIPKGVSKNLGKNATALYRKSLICRNHGFGLAAVAYMRRVVEDKTNELIEIAAKLAESHGIDSSTISKMREAADSTKYTSYEEKLNVAATVFPQSLIVGGANPLAILYGLVSEGLHGLGETDCIVIADRTKDVFEYVFEKLQAEIDNRKAFVDKVTKLV